MSGDLTIFPGLTGSRQQAHPLVHSRVTGSWPEGYILQAGP